MNHPLYPDAAFVRRNYHHPVFSDLRAELESIDLGAQRDFLNHRVNLRDYAVDLREVTQIAERMTFLAIGSGREEASDLALRAIAKLMEYSKWDYFMEGGRIPIGVMRAQNANLAVSLVCEYLGARIPESTRIEWIQGMAGKGIELCFNSLQSMRHPDRVEGWGFDPESTYLERFPEHLGLSLARFPRLFQANNLRAVTTNGLLTGVVTHLREFGRSDDSDRWLEQARHSFSTLGRLYAPDGSYEEGVPYSGYTSVQMVDLIRHFEWLDKEPRHDCVNWKGNTSFLLNMSAPTFDHPARIITFSDGPIAPAPAVSMWVAGRFKDPLAQWYALNRTSPADPRALLHFDPSIPSSPPQSRPYLFRTPFDWITAGGGYEPDDLVCAMRSGPPSNHEHADRNSIFLKCWGELLLPDPAPVPYSYLDPSWSLRLTGAHNAVLIDGRGHQYVDGHDGTNASEAHAHLLEVTEGDGWMQWASDASQAYQRVDPDVVSVVRSVAVLPGFPLVVVADKVVKQSTPSSMQARFLAHNADGLAGLDSGERSFRISRPAARLDGLIFSDGSFTVAPGSLPVAKEKAAAYPFIEVATDKSMEPFLVSLLFPLRGDEETPEVDMIRDSDQAIEFRISSRGGAVRVIVDRSGAVPVLRVSRAR